MMPREKFGWRRATETIEIPHRYPSGAEHVLCVSLSRLPSGKIGEFWLNAVDGYEKRVNDDMRDACIAASKDLQNGDTLEYLSKSVLRDAKGKPHGFLGSVIDRLKKEPVDA